MISNREYKDPKQLIFHGEQWDEFTDSTKKQILKALPRNQKLCLESTIDHESYVLRWTCSVSGLVVFEEQISQRLKNSFRKGYLDLHQLKTIDEVEDYFCAYSSRKVTTHNDCFKLTEDLSSAGYSYLQQVITSVKGKNFCLIDNKKLRAEVGKNRYRKGRHELINKGLIRPCPTKLKHPYEIIEIHPVLAYRGKSLDENFDPVWRWTFKSFIAAEN